MTAPASSIVEPFFLRTTDHALFCLAGRLAPGVQRTGIGVLICPPFAEEMNRVRPTQRLLTESLAREGTIAIACDLRGTGDSDGDFAEARWGDWLDDLGAAADWLHRAGCERLVLLGVRAGALLAGAFLDRSARNLAAVVLWQPQLAGKAVLTDLLRGRVAAAAAVGERESVAALRSALAAGQTVEAAGYAIGGGLAAALDQVTLPDSLAERANTLLWLEITSAAATPVRPAANALVNRWRGLRLPVTLSQVVDPPFWSTTETTIGTATVAATVAELQRCT